MRIANRLERAKPETSLRTAGTMFLAAAWMLAATAGLAQSASTDDQRMGVSHPDPTPITVTPYTQAAPSSTATPPAKPSADIPAPAPATDSSQIVYGPYVPYHAPGTAAQAAPAASAQPFDPDASIVTAATAGGDERRLLTGSANGGQDAGIVTYVRSQPGEIPEGSLVKVKLLQELSTLTTQPGTKFSAVVSEPLMRNGQVIVPVGSILEGRVTWVRGGKRIGGPAAIHLDPREITLPDGSQYVLRAQAIDTDRWDLMKVDDEGTIERRGQGKKTAAAMGLAAGSGLAAGAVLGGVPGAVIGAGVGAGVGTVMWLKSDRQADLKKNLGVVFSLTEPMDVTPARAAMATVKPGMPGGE